MCKSENDPDETCLSLDSLYESCLSLCSLCKCSFCKKKKVYQSDDANEEPEEIVPPKKSDYELVEQSSVVTTKRPDFELMEQSLVTSNT